MDTTKLWKQAALRGAIIAGLVVGFGYLVYDSAIFIHSMKPFQFLETGVTLGIAYAGFKSGFPRIGVIGLFVWYVLITGQHALNNSWSFILFGVYIIGITSAVYFYTRMVDRPLVRGRIRRIIAMSLIVGIANSVIVIFLGLLMLPAVLAETEIFLQAIYFNLTIGILMGALSGLGIEISEYLIAQLWLREKIAG